MFPHARQLHYCRRHAKPVLKPVHKRLHLFQWLMVVWLFGFDLLNLTKSLFLSGPGVSVRGFRGTIVQSGGAAL